nr:MAG TPA: bacterial regulatory protein [Caudoviricetes sp.]
MKDNAVKVQDVEIYLDNINICADEYINTVLCVSPDNENYRKEVADSFVDMIFYIADHIQKPSNDDIELLDKMFSTYVRLCSKYHVLPTLEVFSFLVGINRSTFSDWMRGDYRTSSAHGTTVKKWFDICKNCTLNRLHNQAGTNANLIFVAKAAYGMAETAPVQAGQQYGVPHQTAQQIAEKHKAALQLPEMEKPVL